MSGLMEWINLDCEFWQQFGVHADMVGDGFPTCCSFDRCDYCGQVVCTGHDRDASCRSRAVSQN